MRVLQLLLLALITSALYGQPASVLSTGKWFKLSVAADGVYRIDYGMVKSMGMNPDGIDPHKIQLFAGMNGMLPQLNQSARIDDLKQVALFEVGLQDGRFNNGDYILFFGQGPDRYELDPALGTYRYENNLYSDKNYYFLTVAPTNGLRLTTQANLSGNFPEVSEYDHFDYYENDQTSELHSGRTWYGERFDATVEYTVRFPISNILSGSQINIMTSVMGRSTSASSFQFSLNGHPIADQAVPPVTDIPYAIIGADVKDTISVDANSAGAPLQSNQDVKIHFTKASTGQSIGYLDYLLVHARRALALYGSQMSFSSLRSLEQPTTRYVFPSASSALVWDVTDPFEPKIQETSFQSSTGTMSFAASSNSLRRYVQFILPGDAPALEGEVSNQNLKGIGSTNLLVISAGEFISEANRFAEHRRNTSGIDVTVVTAQQVYNEFSGGKQDVTALRDFVKYLYDKGTGIRNVLLFGRGSFDYKNRLSYNRNFIPIYQSRNSLNPLETYASDDYIGFLEPQEGNWSESPAELHTLEVGVGRIPVKNLDEAASWVSKVISYEHANWGPWRKKILFTADDGDLNLHQSQAEQLANQLAIDHPEVEVKKVFLDAYTQKNSSQGQTSPEARKALNTAVSDGIGILNYTGHGSELQWMQERILDQRSFDEWKPRNHYPFLVTATCEFGRHDDPGLISSAELSLFRSNSGSIGMITTSRPVFSSTNFPLNKAFYQSLFTRSGGDIQDWGAIFRLTKNNSISGVANRNFALLGDPSMLPPLGSREVAIDGITNVTSGSDTLKALSTVRVQGSVHYQGTVDAQYEGVVQLTLFNKPTSRLTKGDENAPFSYTLQDDALFRGNASVGAGQFDMEFIVPQSIDPQVGSGLIGLYVSPRAEDGDGLGAKMNVKVGSAETVTGNDTLGPGIELYMGDTTFISGGLIGTNSRIIAVLTDNSGIDISNFNPQNDIIAVLDDTATFNLNAYYQSDVDNFKRGKVDFPLSGLLPGHHQLRLSATDSYGNTNTATISFTVTDQPGIQIEQWLNYPNPFSTTTTFHFKHNRPGEDLEAQVTVFDRMGKVVLNNTYQIGASTYKVDLPAWDGTSADGNKLGGGLYVMKLAVRSMLDGTKNERIAKVILLN